MPATYELKYQDGRVEEHFGHRGYYYVLEADTLLSFFPIPAWCRNCDAITLAEDLQKPEQIKSEIKELETPGSARFPSSPEARVAYQSYLEGRLALLARRKSPPRCMKCGKAEVTFFVSGEWSPHPKTGELIMFSAVGMCSTNFAMRFFNPEGEELTLTEIEQEHYDSLAKSQGFFCV